MATQSVPLPDRLVLTEDRLDELRQLAESQNISLSDALAQAIHISGFVRRSISDPDTKLLLKKGRSYSELMWPGRENGTGQSR